MSRTLSILAILGAVLAALTATILVDVAPAAVALYAIGAGVFLVISRDWRRIAPGAAAIILGILGILGVIGSVGGEKSSIDFPISVPVGQALIVAAALAVAGTTVIVSWKHFEPEWISYVWAGVWGLASVLALVYRAHLGDQTQTGSYVVAVLALANLGAPIMWMLHARSAGAPHHASRAPDAAQE